MRLCPKFYNNIFINGMPGSGKSTFGRMYAVLSGKSFLDFDDFLEKSLNTKIDKIFQNYGVQKFRTLETDVLKSMGNLTNHVIALGGGTLLSQENCNFVTENGFIASLVGLPLQILAERIWNDKNTPNIRVRPLFFDCNTVEKVYVKIKDLHNERQKIYQNAHVILDQNLNSTANLLFMLKFKEQVDFRLDF